MLEEIMKAERAAAECGSWSDSEAPSLSADEEEALPLVHQPATHLRYEDINCKLKPKDDKQYAWSNVSTKQLLFLWIGL